ncbi:efflux RND transporter permease subunit [Brevibacillus brevis]|uniref:efflux RND transporter permease subunit n=1 Tax=Brevibacillus brevis TaxID=1393 RepID=UPI00115A63D3|nr:efflux RND transporter permease subunit [Lysinibacillus sp. SDF0063]TQR30149.1 efflux RND transporter permease subunit [Lysinibacillus sp. SDF0063]
MNISELSIKRPVTMIMISIAIFIFGLVTFPRLAIELMPSLNAPVAVVVTSVEGAAPAEVEKLVTKPIENALGTVPNLDKVTSTSVNGSSSVILHFKWGTDMDQATLNMRDKVDLVRGSLPESAGSPRVLKFDPTSQPILDLAVTGDQDVNKLKKIADDVIKARLERINGVASVTVTGGQERIVDIIVDPAKLAAYGLTLDQIKAALENSNISGSAGAIREGDAKTSIRVQGEFTNVDTIALTPISVGGSFIRLSDIANVTDTIKEVTNLSYIDGKPSLGISVMKGTGGNTIKIAKDVKAELEKINSTLPANVETSIVLDTSTYIQSSVDNTVVHALAGGAIGVLMLFFFLGSLSSMLIAVIVLPVSIISTFLLMYMTGQTINLISLAGLTLGLGSLVDFAVVMLENIFRQREQGKGMMEAALVGSKEVGTAVMASALAQICVFLPIALTEGIVAELFAPLALTVVFSHIAALVFTFLLVPMMSARLLKTVPEHTNHENYRGFNPLTWFNIGFHKVEKGYQRVLKWALGHRKTVIGSAFAMLIGSLMLVPTLGAGFFPDMDQGVIQVEIKLPKGTVLTETEKVMKQVEEVVNQVPEKKLVKSSVGGGDGISESGASTSHNATIELHVGEITTRQRSTEAIAVGLQEQVKHIAGADIKVKSLSGGMGGGAAISIEIRGDDLDVLTELSEIVKGEIAKVPGTMNVSTSVKEMSQEFDVKVDTEKASLYGLTTNEILSAVRTSFQGQTVTQYRTGEDEIDINLKLPKDYKEDINYLKNLRISTPTGAQISLTSVATISKVDVPPSIERKNMTREVTVTSDFIGDNLQAAATEVTNIINKLNVPDGYTIEMGGQSEDMGNSFVNLGLAIILSVVLVYMVMAAQFESLFSPFIIMFSVPPSLTGVILGLLFTGTPITVSVLIGYILLIGLVVNNAIVLIDLINQLRAKGWELHEAILHAGPARLRPILMTTLTTIMAIAPLSVAAGSGLELQAPMATTVMYGLIFSTMITLILVPVVTVSFDEMGQKRRNKRKQKQEKKIRTTLESTNA